MCAEMDNQYKITPKCVLVVSVMWVVLCVISLLLSPIQHMDEFDLDRRMETPGCDHTWEMVKNMTTGEEKPRIIHGASCDAMEFEYRDKWCPETLQRDNDNNPTGINTPPCRLFIWYHNSQKTSEQCVDTITTVFNLWPVIDVLSDWCKSTSCKHPQELLNNMYEDSWTCCVFCFCLTCMSHIVTNKLWPTLKGYKCHAIVLLCMWAGSTAFAIHVLMTPNQQNSLQREHVVDKILSALGYVLTIIMSAVQFVSSTLKTSVTYIHPITSHVVENAMTDCAIRYILYAVALFSKRVQIKSSVITAIEFILQIEKSQQVRMRTSPAIGDLIVQHTRFQSSIQIDSWYDYCMMNSHWVAFIIAVLYTRRQPEVYGLMFVTAVIKVLFYFLNSWTQWTVWFTGWIYGTTSVLPTIERVFVWCVLVLYCTGFCYRKMISFARMVCAQNNNNTNTPRLTMGMGKEA